MSSENWEHEFFEVMKAEHQELATVLREIRSAVSSEDRNRNQVEDLITRLSELMEVHFRHEEEGGYLKEALENLNGRFEVDPSWFTPVWNRRRGGLVSSLIFTHFQTGC